MSKYKPNIKMNTPTITTENVAELVKKYYESKELTVFGSAYKKYSMLFKKEEMPFADADLYNIFWAIRLLAESGKYDWDDIEFHVKKNPIFLEINTDDDEEKHKGEKKANQVGLLRYTINEYKRRLERNAGQIIQGSLVGAKL
jgi:hypothetical protein